MGYSGAWGKLIDEKNQKRKISWHCPFKLNPLPHGVLATFSLTAKGFMGRPKKDDISREKAIGMTSLGTNRASAVSSQGLHCTYPPPPSPRAIERS